ncbi:hypothetical protein [Streptomyces sp. NPDC002402]
MPSKAAAFTTARKTMPLSPTAPFTDANALEDSALLAALGNSSGNVHAPDGARLVSIGLATVNDKGHYFLTEDGHAAAQGLRQRERLLISDAALKVIGNGRAHGKATGWIAGVTSSRRAYIEMVRLPHTTPETFDDLVTRGTWYGLRFQLCSRLGIHAEHEGARIYLGYASVSGASRAAEHADNVWNDLCRDHRVHGIHPPSTVYTAPTGLLFHYASRHVLLSRDEHGRPRAEITNGPDVGRSWTGHRADVAMKAMCSSLYGTPCAHGCVTGRDSCTGCDATAEAFENTHGTLLGPMPADPLA